MLVFSALYTGVNFKPSISGGVELSLNLNDVLKPLAFGFMVGRASSSVWGGQTG